MINSITDFSFKFNSSVKLNFDGRGLVTFQSKCNPEKFLVAFTLTINVKENVNIFFEKVIDL